MSKEDLKLADDKGSKKREKALKVGAAWILSIHLWAPMHATRRTGGAGCGWLR